VVRHAYPTAKFYPALALDQDIYARHFKSFQDPLKFDARFVHVLEKTDILCLYEMEQSCRAGEFAFIDNGLGGFPVATDDDDVQTRSIIAMGLAEFADCEFSNAICCAYEDCGKWLCFDESGVCGGDGCEFDHCGGWESRGDEFKGKACQEAWRSQRDISIVIGQRMRCRYISDRDVFRGREG